MVKWNEADYLQKKETKNLILCLYCNKKTSKSWFFYLVMSLSYWFPNIMGIPLFPEPMMTTLLLED